MSKADNLVLLLDFHNFQLKTREKMDTIMLGITNGYDAFAISLDESILVQTGLNYFLTGIYIF